MPGHREELAEPEVEFNHVGTEHSVEIRSEGEGCSVCSASKLTLVYYQLSRVCQSRTLQKLLFVFCFVLFVK